MFSEDENEKDEDDEIDDDDDDDEDKSKSKRPGPPFVVKLVDFAHTRFASGEGPDQNLLIGTRYWQYTRLGEIGAS